MEAEDGLLFMQEMLELSKIQSQQPERAPQAVSVTVKDKIGEELVILMKGGPSQFGKNLVGDEKVTAKTVFIHPFRGCAEILEPEIIKGKIAIMERGDCMFVDKVRRVQKHGAVGAIIVDNVPGSNSMSSPLFSMSGDGTEDVTIPSVFLFTQDASKLLLAISKDPKVEVTLSELKDNDNFSQNEEESMFHKLKISVQEFLNKHTGIAFTKIVEVGEFRANIGNDKIRITREGNKEHNIPKELNVNQQWSQIRKGLLKSILHSDTKELYVPLNILRIYYQTLSGASIEELKQTDIIKQTEWLLTELSKEHQNKEDDLVKPETDQSISLLADLDQFAEVESEVLLNQKIENVKETPPKLTQSEKEAIIRHKREKLAELNSLLDTVQHLEKAYQVKDALNEVFNKLKLDSSDDIIVANLKNEDSDKSDVKQDKINKGVDIKTKVNHVVDEL